MSAPFPAGLRLTAHVSQNTALQAAITNQFASTCQMKPGEVRVPGSKQMSHSWTCWMKGLCAEGALTNDAESGESSGPGGDIATPNEEGKRGLGVKSWVQRQGLAEMDTDTGAQAGQAQRSKHPDSLSPAHSLSSLHWPNHPNARRQSVLKAVSLRASQGREQDRERL